MRTTSPTTSTSSSTGPATATAPPSSAGSDRVAAYRAPDVLTRRVLNPLVRGLARLGISLRGAHLLEVRGRTTGEPRRTPVNPLPLEGREYLVAPRGETQWVRNLRADDGRLVLVLGRRRTARLALELPDTEKVPVLRAYLQRWSAETGALFGIDAGAPDEELLAIAPRHPVFVLSDPA